VSPDEVSLRYIRGFDERVGCTPRTKTCGLDRRVRDADHCLDHPATFFCKMGGRMSGVVRARQPAANTAIRGAT
jgi:hypothetical protein